MQKVSNITALYPSDKGNNGNLISNWDMANISRLFQLRLVRWVATTGSITGLLSLFAGVARADTMNFTNVGAKAFSPSELTTDESVFNYEFRDDIKLSPYDWNVNTASCNSSDLSAYKSISTNAAEIDALTPNSCFNLNFDGFAVKYFDFLEE